MRKSVVRTIATVLAIAVTALAAPADAKGKGKGKKPKDTQQFLAVKMNDVMVTSWRPANCCRPYGRMIASGRPCTASIPPPGLLTDAPTFQLQPPAATGAPIRPAGGASPTGGGIVIR
jgi:hypothetical protein